MGASELIHEKAFELFKRYGIKRVTMDEVASQCGVSKKTLYQHFADKDTLVETIMGSMIGKSEAQCIIFHKESENAVHELFRSLDMLQEMFEGINPVMIYDLHKYHQATFKKLENHKQHFLHKQISMNLERGIAEGVFRADIKVEIITLLHLYTISMVFEQESFPRNKYSLFEMQMEIMLHYIYGIATAKGVKLIEKYKKQRIKYQS